MVGEKWFAGNLWASADISVGNGHQNGDQSDTS
jgi:hypothetical protein